MEAHDLNVENAPAQHEKPEGRSCFSCLYAMFSSSLFLFSAAFLMILFVFLQASAELMLAAAVTLLVSFWWQLRASRRGCLMPLVIIALSAAIEISLLGIVIYGVDTQKNTNFKKLQHFLDQHAPGLYSACSENLQTLARESRQILDSGLQTLQISLQQFSLSDEEKNIARLEAAFSNNPGDAAVVLALADAYLQKNDLASLKLAISLYEALVETAPSDAFFARLAEAYTRIYRYDLAFSTAARRLWLPHAMAGKAARQLALIAVCSGDLARGIFELENILQLNPVESEEVMLLLAGLYNDMGNKPRALELLDRVIASAPAELSVARTAINMKQAIGN